MTSRGSEEEVGDGGGGRWSLGTLVRSKSLSSDPEDEEDKEPELEVTFFSAQKHFTCPPKNMLLLQFT